MRKILFLIVFLCIVVGLAPYIDGYFFKTNYFNLIDAINRDSKFRLTVVSYQQGWRQSQAVVKVNHLSRSTSEFETITLNQTIKHGPIVHNPLTQGYSLALASVKSIIRYSYKVEAFLGRQPNQGLATLYSVAKFGDQYQNRLDIPPIMLSMAGMGKLSWQGLKGDIDFQLKDNNLQAMKSNVVFGSLTIQSDNPAFADLAFSSQPLTSVNESIRHPIGLYNGHSDVNLPDVSLLSAGKTKFGLQSLKINGKTQVSNDQFYNLSNDIQIQQIEYPEWSVPSITQVNIRASLYHLNAQAILDFIKKARATANQSGEERRRTFEPLLGKLITTSTTFDANVAFNSNLGPFKLKAKALWPTNVPLPQSLQDILDKAHLTVDLQLAAPLAHAIVTEEIDIMGDDSPEPVIPPATEASSTSAAPILSSSNDKTAFNQQVAALVKQNKLTMPMALELMDMWDKQATAEAFAQNVQQLKLDSATESELISTYTKQHAPIPPVLTPVTTAPQVAAQNITPEEKASIAAKKQIDEWVAAGYLIPEQNDYHIVIVRENGETQVNGKPFVLE